MQYLEELNSGRSPLIKKAAKQILKGRLKGYGSYLHEALAGEIEKPKAWETQMYLIHALAVTECVEEIDYLKALLNRDHPATVIYFALTLAIVYLENAESENLSFVYDALASNNTLKAAGACAALYARKMILKDEDFKKVMNYVSQAHYLKNMTQVISPFIYILASSYLYSEQNRHEIVFFAKQYEDRQLICDILNDVSKNKDGKRIGPF